MADPISNHATLRNKFELEKWHRSYADFRSKVVKSLPEMEKASPSNCSEKQKALHMEEIVKHMKHLPSYLERGKPIQDQALSFGVMDWGRLEKWQNLHHKQGIVRSNKCSPSSSNSSSLFSTDGSSPLSGRGQSCSPVRQRVHRVTLQSHFKASPKEDFTPKVKLSSGNFDKFQDFKNSRSQCKLLLDVGSCHTPPPSSASKGKLKIRDESVNELRNGQDPSCRTCNDDHPEKHENVLFLARNVPGSNQTNGNTFQSEFIHSKNSQMELDSVRNHSSPSRKKTPERKRSTGSSKSSDLKTSNTAVSKPRSTSPLRRFSFSLSTSSKSAAPKSATERVGSPVSQHSTKDSNRGHSSPLRRLLDPIFPPKARQFAETCDEDSRTKAKKKLDFRNSKEIRADDLSSSKKQALFQTAFKNGRLLFTFAVENNKDVLAATMTSLSSSGKDDNKSWLYTFFTVNEVKKKNVNWLSQGSKSKDHGYVSNVTAQMKVSNPFSSHCDMREFVLFSVNPNVQPQEELEAIVVKFPRKVNREDNQESFSTTVILPGGNHGVPSKGEPSPLIDRWRSGGACDCGGWDMGCRLNTLSNQVQSSGSRSNKVHTTAGQFELFFQGEVGNKRSIFSLSPLKEGIFSVEYNSSLSPLQAFSICISVAECRKTSQHTELRTHVREEVPVPYTPTPCKW
ncbi:uncharacterized protein LOC112506857 [Cynara cardunculus var. scolymus]|uniref:Uncharacterized protein n=1 Tax=Cynara cardunculus var. scolymus TaxID=59895 RepID=A0A118K7A4_CYNCS|nr:uncharacterized protein LOC112506857 [Cynara cardunculus var. scolymus]KVI11912.1 Protein of unknown function DUF3527 [Cynara cardunculus var. scolymus]